MNYTKIVATLGPASCTYPMIKAILEAGCRVIRLNFSHGSHEEQQMRHDLVRQASRELGIPVAILMDLQGPKIRLGQLKEPSYTLEKGETLVVTTIPYLGTRNRVSIDYPYLHEEILPGSRILINDGLVLGGERSKVRTSIAGCWRRDAYCTQGGESSLGSPAVSQLIHQEG